MLTLRDITAELKKVLLQIEAAEGELTPDIKKELLITENNLVEKCSDYVGLIELLESYSERITNEVNRLTAVKKRNEATIAYLKDGLKTAVELYGPLQTHFNRVYLRKTKAAVIQNADKVPDRFKTVKIDVSIDKKALKAAIEGGELQNCEAYFVKENENIIIS